MADIDSLQLHITVQDSASETLINLKNNLDALKVSLKGINTNGIDKLGNSLNRLSDIGKASKNTKTINEMVSALQKAQNISPRATQQLTEAYEDFYKALAKNVTGKETDSYLYKIARIAEENIRVKKTFSDLELEIRDAVKTFSKTTTKRVGIADLAGEFADKEAFREFQRNLGAGFDAKKVGGFDQFLDVLREIDGASSIIDFSNYQNAAKQLNAILNDTKKESLSLYEALQKINKEDIPLQEDPKILEDSIWKQIVEDYSALGEPLLKMQEAGEKTSVEFSYISDALKSISDIKVPDISGIADLADYIGKLGAKAVSAGVNNLNKIADSLNRLSDTSIPSFEGLKNLSDNVGNVKPMKVSRPSVTTVNTDGSLVKEKSDIDSLTVSLNGLGNAYQNLFGYQEGFTSNIQDVNNLKGYIDAAGDTIDGKLVPAIINSYGWFEKLSYSVKQLRLPDFGERLVPAIRDMETSLGSTVQNMEGRVKDFYNGVVDAIEGIDFKPIEDNAKEAFDRIGAWSEAAMQYIHQQLETAGEYFNNINIGQYEFAPTRTTYKAGDMGEADVTKAVRPSKDLLANFVVLGHEIENVSRQFSNLGDIGTRALKAIYTPLRLLVDGWKEKFSAFGDVAGKAFGAIRSTVVNKIKDIPKPFETAVNKMKSSLKKLSDFWKRTMRTFTFMLVRKAITAVIDGIEEAKKSLAQFSRLVGTSFNTSISNAVADFNWLSRAIMGAFEPIINFVVPILDTLAAAIQRVLTLIGEFFAALTGQSYFMIAKKNVDDYAESVSGAEKQQRKLLLGIDEINVLPSQNNSGGSASNPMADWDMGEVSDKMKDFADKVKSILNELFKPLKAAWDETGAYVINGFKYMVSELARLGQSIGRDFLAVWNQPETIAMFANILGMIGDMEYAIGNLARNFREAWDEANRGLRILENIRDILATLVQHARNMTSVFKDWTDQLDFRPLLSSFESLTGSMVRLADFVGTAIERIFVRIVLPYMKYLIESAIPRLNQGIADMLDKINFDGIMASLDNVWLQAELILVEITSGILNLVEAAENLVVNFANAWVEAGRGKTIMDGIAAVMQTLVGHAYRVTQEIKDWSVDVDFGPALDSIGRFVQALNPVADAIGRLFEDVMKNVVLKYLSFLIEDGLPHLMDSITAVMNAFDFDKILNDLKPVEDSFERLLENLHTGVANAIKNVGEAIAQWANSDDFTKFMDAIASIMDRITAERVEKLFTALGEGILNVAKSIADFISSDGFQNFLDKLMEWYDSKSAGEIAGILENIAKAIAAFKFIGFAGEGIAGFFKFVTIASSLSSINTTLAGLGTATSAAGVGAATAGVGFGGFAAALAPIAGVIAGVTLGAYSLTESFGGIEGLMQRLGEAVSFVKDNLAQFAKTIGFSEKVDQLKKSFQGMLDKLGDMSDFWDIVISVVSELAVVLGKTLVVAVDVAMSALEALFKAIGGMADILGGVGTALVGLLNVDFTTFFDGVKRIGEGIVEVFTGMVDLVIELVKRLVDGVIGFFKNLKYQLIGDPIVIDMWNGIVSAFSEGIGNAIAFVGEFVSGVIEKAIELKDTVVQHITEFKDGVVERFAELKDGAVQKAIEFKDGAVEKFAELKDKAVEKTTELKDNVVKKVSELKENAVKKAGEFKDNIVKKFTETKEKSQQAIEKLKDTATSKYDAMKEKLVNVASSIKDKVSNKFSSLKDTAGQKFDAMKSVISSRMDSILSVCQAKAQQIVAKFNAINLQSVGSHVISGFRQGLQSAWASVVSWASSAVASLKSTFQSGLQIHSPSKVFERYGKYTVEGFNNGLEEMSSTTGKVMDAWMSDFSDMQVTLAPQMDYDFASMAPTSMPIAQDIALSATGDIEDVLVSAFSKALAQQADNGNVNVNVTLEGDASALFNAVVRQTQQTIQRTGRNPLAA